MHRVIVTIDRSDESTAFIKLRCQLPPRYFTDYLVAMKSSDGWQIVSKSDRYDLRDRARPAQRETVPYKSGMTYLRIVIPLYHFV